MIFGNPTMAIGPCAPREDLTQACPCQYRREPLAAAGMLAQHYTGGRSNAASGGPPLKWGADPGGRCARGVTHNLIARSPMSISLLSGPSPFAAKFLWRATRP